MDPLDFWMGNQEVLESLAEYLRPKHLAALAQTSKRWRDALNVNHMWKALAKKNDWDKEMYLMDWKTESDEVTLEPLCEWWQVYIWCSGARKAWRSGAGKRVLLNVPHRVRSSVAVCYDCDGDLLAVGTNVGQLILWHVTMGWRGAVQGMKPGKIDKVYVRHGLAVFVQGGLVQVCQPAEAPAIVYCKTFEHPDLAMLWEGEPNPDMTSVPDLSRNLFRERYIPQHPVTFPAEMDITLSTVGQERLGAGLVGQAGIIVYHLRDGELEQELQLEEGLVLVKLGIVQLVEASNLLYVLVREGAGQTELCGLMYNLDMETDPAPLWRLPLHQHFNYQFSVFSIFSTRGILMFGRKQGDNDYPYTWLWRAFHYQTGQQVFSFDHTTEFDMYLSDWSEDALITPRAMTYLFPADDTLVFSQQTHRYQSTSQQRHRGVATIGFQWGHDNTTRKIWQFNKASRVGRATSNMALAGSQVAGVVVAKTGDSVLCYRDLKSGIKLAEVDIESHISSLWADDTKIVIINRQLNCSHPICVIVMD